MNFLKKSLSLLLILALLIPCIASVNAWLMQTYTIVYHGPGNTVSSHHGEANQYVTISGEYDAYVGYDFIGWVEEEIKKAQLSDLSEIYYPGDSIYVTTDPLYFYALYAKKTDSGYAYYSTFIEKTEAPFAIRHSLDLANGIAVNFFIDKTDLQEYDSIKFYANIPVYKGNALIETNTSRMGEKDCDPFCCITTNIVNAAQMNEPITVTMYLTKDKESMIVEHQYSIATYLYSLLNNQSSSDTLKTLCANLLQYGKWAQIYKNCHTNALVDQKMTKEHRAYLTDLNTVSFENTNTQLDDLPDAPIQWVGKALDLQSNVTLKCAVDCSNYDGYIANPLINTYLHVQYTDSQGETHTLNGYDRGTIDHDKGLYSISFSGLPVSELRTPLELRILEENGTQVSTTLCYSLATYGNGKTGTLLSLCQALMAYSDSVVAYMAR